MNWINIISCNSTDIDDDDEATFAFHSNRFEIQIVVVSYRRHSRHCIRRFRRRRLSSRMMIMAQSIGALTMNGSIFPNPSDDVVVVVVVAAVPVVPVVSYEVSPW